MEKHRDKHRTRAAYSGGSNLRPCVLYPELQARQFGHDRCNAPLELVSNGLRYSTETADLIAVNDGEEYGVYLFKTQGGRYFMVSSNWPLRDQGTEDIRLLSTEAAVDVYQRANKYGNAERVSFQEAFPDYAVTEA